MSDKQLKIEELLEVMGSKEHVGSSEHRYELRRSLLCSRFFAAETACMSRWDKMMTYTAPLVAGGMMVGVFTLMVVYAPIEPEVGPQTRFSKESSLEADQYASLEVLPINAEDFLSDPAQPTVQLVGFQTEQSRPVMHYTPLTSQEYVRTQ
ncbi:hypothetical protein HQ487_01365 [Candidatus Uhrbacteria bacterium]|nr:hypothetical protein [Candidatus Uhrbacteria bacterium]